MKVIGSRLREQKDVETPYSRNEITSVGNNSPSVTHTAVKFVCSMGFLTMADGTEWCECDRHLRDVTGSDYVQHIRGWSALESNLVMK